MFYAQHHGHWRLDMQVENMPSYRQPFQMGGIKPEEKVAYIDALATADAETIYIHAINRHFQQDLPVVIDLTAVSGLTGRVIHHIYEGRLHNSPQASESKEMGWSREETLQLKDQTLKVTLPKRSISCLEIARSERPDYAVEYLNHNTPATATAGETLPVQITIQNTSRQSWVTAGNHPFRLGYQWYTADGVALSTSLWDDNRTALPHPIAPGESVTLTSQLSIPRVAGDLEVRWDMVEELRTWFAWQGVATLNVPVRVEEVIDLPQPVGLIVSASHNNRQTGADNLLQATDSNPTTRWSTQTPQQPGMWFQIDLGQVRTISQISLNNDLSPRDYPRGYVAKLSTDEQSWQTVAENPNNDRPLAISFSPQHTRFIRIEQTGSDPIYWWSIHRIDLAGGVKLTARASHNNTQTGVDNVAQALDGRADTRWSTQTPQRPGMWFEITLSETRHLSGLTFDNAGSPKDYPRGYRLYVATDRNNWQEVGRRDQNMGPVNVRFSPRPVRLIYIEQTGHSENWWWSIHKVTVSST